MNVIRFILGKIILFLDKCFSPQLEVSLSPEKQKELDVKLKNLSLYQLEMCPFCVKVRRGLKRLGMNIELRDIKKNTHYAKELVEQGGNDQVPCLRIQHSDGTVQWLYESDDILSYLKTLIS